MSIFETECPRVDNGTIAKLTLDPVEMEKSRNVVVDTTKNVAPLRGSAFGHRTIDLPLRGKHAFEVALPLGGAVERPVDRGGRCVDPGDTGH